MSDNSQSVKEDEDLPTYVVIVIGVICAVIVIALSIVLIYLCWKRRQSIRKYKEESAKAVNNRQTTNNGNGLAGTTNLVRSNPNSYDNPAQSEPSSPPPRYDDASAIAPVFATQSSQNEYFQQHSVPNANGYLNNGGINSMAYTFENQSNLNRERSFKGSGSHQPPSRDVTDSGSYAMSNRNSSTGDKGIVYLEDNYRQTKDTHNNSGEGSMGSDQNKPKKVMYEVVV